MYPDLLEIFGVTLHGLMFERVLWGIGVLVMLWGVVSTISIFLKGRIGEAIVQGLIVVAILYWCAQSLTATFMPNYVLTFQQPVVIHSYAFCILLGIIFGTLSAMWMAPNRGIQKSWIVKLCLWFVLIGFVGARAAHVIVERQFYLDSCFNPSVVGLAEPNCWRALDVSEGGLTFYGGVIAGFLVLIVGYIIQRRRNPNFKLFHLVDSLAVALAMAHGFGRIGCLAAGCCWGALTTSGWGVHYPPGSFAYVELAKDPNWMPVLEALGRTPAMHPSQLYEAGGEFILFAIMVCMAVRQHRRQDDLIYEVASQVPGAKRSKRSRRIMPKLFGGKEGDMGDASAKAPERESQVKVDSSGNREVALDSSLSSALNGLSSLQEMPKESNDSPATAVPLLKKSGDAGRAGNDAASKVPVLTRKEEPKRNVMIDIEQGPLAQKARVRHALNLMKSSQKAKDEESAKSAAPELSMVERYMPEQPGKITAWWFIGYGVLRFVVEMMRDDTERGYYLQKVFPEINRFLDVSPDHVTVLSTSQGIALGMIVFGMIALLCSTKKRA